MENKRYKIEKVAYSWVLAVIKKQTCEFYKTTFQKL